jgi:hypothetical protein
MNLKELERLRIFFKNNEILLVCADKIGDVELPETNWTFIEDCLVDGDIKGIKFEK